MIPGFSAGPDSTSCRFQYAAALLEERSAGIGLAVATFVGLAYAVVLFGITGVLGTAPFWQLPSGLDGTIDMRETTSGYYWFVEEEWRWPLLAVRNPNWPAGTNAAFFDIAPWVAIVGKLIYSVFGWRVNPYPLWAATCIALNGSALFLLVRTMGGRSILTAILSGGLGAMGPAIQYRFVLSHLTLLAHWLPILALALYFHAVRQGFRWQSVACAIGLCFIAAGIHFYFYAMTAAIGAALVLQWILNRDCSVFKAGLVLAALVFAGALPLWAFGVFEGGSLGSATGDSARYSMNLMSPFWPQMSGLFQWTGIYWLTRGTIGAHPGQYEGFNYLGGGALLLIAVALWTEGWSGLLSALRNNLALTATVIVLTLWAISNEIYFGPYKVFSYEMPQFISETVLAWFRSSGRMFWPVASLILAFGIAKGGKQFRPPAMLAFTVLILALQWIETVPLRTRISPLFSAPAVSYFGTPSDAARVAETIRSVGDVVVIPAIFCPPDFADFNSPLNLAASEVQLMAARANARMRAVYLSRQHVDCSKWPAEGERSVIIMLKRNGAPVIDSAALSQTAACFELDAARVCTTK
jgi:hypothetical protein